MLLNKLSRTVFNILFFKFKSIPVIVRWKSFTHCENFRTKFDWEFRRDVLKNTNGCILYDPSKQYSPSEKFIQNDETILNLIEINKFYKLNGNENEEFHSKQLKTELRAFDRKCFQNTKKWIIDQILFVLDIYDSLQPIRTNFSTATPKYCLKYLKDIPKGQQLQLMHYLAYSKVTIDDSQQWLIIEKLVDILDDLSVAEVSFYCSALVRCDGQASEKYSNHVKKIMNHLVRRELRDENQMAISSILKAIRKLSTESHIDNLKALQRRLVPLVKKANIIQLSHFVQLGLPQRVFNPKLLELVIEKSLHFIRTEPKAFRIKDVERTLLAIATYRIKTPSGVKETFCKEVQPLLKDSLDTRFRLDMIQCISSLAMIGEVDAALIDWALKYAENERISVTDARHLLVIDSFAKVNLKDIYNGHVLSDEKCFELESIAQTEINHGFHSNMQMDLMAMFKMNNHYASVIKAIPHFIQSDLIFIYNTRTHKTVEFSQPNQCGSIVYAHELYNKQPNLVPVAIVTYGKTSTLHSISSRAVIGRLQMKMNQLRLLGFHMVPWNVNVLQWTQADLEEKLKLLRERLWIEQIQLIDEKIEEQQM